ncbi:MAG: hypothetical protein HY843_05465 [Bdellovibrio sp.]|nr:hypothetical protein [Bdellovibrio sp.]
MQAKKIIVLFFVLLGFASFSFADHDKDVVACYVKQNHYWSGYGNSCWAMVDAAGMIFPAVEAKNYRVNCDYYYGNAYVTFTSLREVPKDQCAEPQEAYWQANQMTVYRDPQVCWQVADAMEWLLSVLTVRNVQYYVYCNPGSMGFIQFQFEALVPKPAI